MNNESNICQDEVAVEEEEEEEEEQHTAEKEPTQIGPNGKKILSWSALKGAFAEVFDNTNKATFSPEYPRQRPASAVKKRSTADNNQGKKRRSGKN